jgi:hypothetical protein
MRTPSSGSGWVSLIGLDLLAGGSRAPFAVGV